MMAMILENVEMIIKMEINNPRMKQSDIAITYALAIISERFGIPVNWTKINDTIRSRYTKSGLERIKGMAWKKLYEVKGVVV